MKRAVAQPSAIALLCVHSALVCLPECQQQAVIAMKAVLRVLTRTRCGLSVIKQWI